MSDDKIIELLEKINKKLSVLVGEKFLDKNITIIDKISILSKASMDYIDISKILGISPAYAAKKLSILKKGWNYGRKRRRDNKNFSWNKWEVR